MTCPASRDIAKHGGMEGLLIGVRPKVKRIGRNSKPMRSESQSG